MVDRESSNADKVRLFLQLFRGRQDVFARRFENAKTGKSGYSPFCQNQWGSGCGLRQGRRCADCAVRRFAPVSEEVACWHLRGRDGRMQPFVMGVYPMAADETVRFAVIDFDEASWRRDALFVVRKARSVGLSVALEKSRSGKGAHLWFFLASPTPARAIREVLTYVLTLVLEEHPEVSLDSYDRIIPNQNTLPKGGFGNLIALPLQAEPRKVDNSVFVDDDWVPHADQWRFLSSLPLNTPEVVDRLLQQARNEHRLLLPHAPSSEEGERPWEFFLPLWSTGTPPTASASRVPEASVRVVLANRVFVEQRNLTPELRRNLIAVSSFVNPQFYEKQRMKLSVYGEPRVISRALNGEAFLQLPRGCLEGARRVLEEGVRRIELEDRRHAGTPLDVSFVGELRIEQKAAVADLGRHDAGILAAGTAFGKTVVAAWMIAARKVNTLVLVNRRQLQEQWVERLAQFLDVPSSEIGRIGGGAKRWSGRIDVALLQSMFRKGVVDPRVKEYGQIIVDECHSVAAESFEAVVDAAPAKYVLGLSATVDRKDGRHPLIMMQCGPVRHRVDPKALSRREPFDHLVHVRPTLFRMPVGGVGDEGRVEFIDLCRNLLADPVRKAQIARDVLAAVAEGRSPVVLTDRKEQLDHLFPLLKDGVRHVITLTGGKGRREMRMIREEMAAIPDSESRVILATGSYLGEGFDDARLDTLFLALPISWKGRLTQFAGRLHRLHDGKREVRIYDYVDLNVGMCAKMYERRMKGYEAIGYKVVLPLGALEGWPVSVELPVIPHWKETFADSIRRLCRDGVDEALANLFVYATLRFELGARTVAPAGSKAAVLKFLQERLESIPATRGVFECGRRLPIPCGSNPYLETDLFSARHRFVVQLDESSGAETEEIYRLARREDIQLQRKGYVVVRFLVADVCARLDDVLETFLELVRPAGQ